MMNDLISGSLSRVPRDVRLMLAREQHHALRAAVRIDALSAVGSHAHRRRAGVAISQRLFSEIAPEATEQLALISEMVGEGIVAAVARLAFTEEP